MVKCDNEEVIVTNAIVVSTISLKEEGYLRLVFFFFSVCIPILVTQISCK